MRMRVAAQSADDEYYISERGGVIEVNISIFIIALQGISHGVVLPTRLKFFLFIVWNLSITHYLTRYKGTYQIYKLPLLLHHFTLI